MHASLSKSLTAQRASTLFLIQERGLISHFVHKIWRTRSEPAEAFISGVYTPGFRSQQLVDRSLTLPESGQTVLLARRIGVEVPVYDSVDAFIDHVEPHLLLSPEKPTSRAHVR